MSFLQQLRGTLKPLGNDGISQMGICWDEWEVLDGVLESRDLPPACIFLLKSPLAIWP